MEYRSSHCRHRQAQALVQIEYVPLPVAGLVVQTHARGTHRDAQQGDTFNGARRMLSYATDGMPDLRGCKQAWIVLDGS